VGKESGKVAGAEHARLVDDKNGATGEGVALPSARVSTLEIEQQPRDRPRMNAGAGLEFRSGTGLDGAADHRKACGAPGTMGGGQAAGLARAGNAGYDVDEVARAAEAADHVPLFRIEPCGMAGGSAGGLGPGQPCPHLPATLPRVLRAVVVTPENRRSARSRPSGALTKLIIRAWTMTLSLVARRVPIQPSPGGC
jgi:hypothetical protein